MYSNLKGPNKNCNHSRFSTLNKGWFTKSCNIVQLNIFLELSLDTDSNGTDITDISDALYSG